MNTRQPQSILSSLFPNRTSALAAEISFLILAGAFAAFVHTVVKIPMQLPGKQGLFFMFILVSVAATSRFKAAGSLATIGAAIFMFVLPGAQPDPFKPFIILLIGVVFDAFLFKARNINNFSVFLIAVAGSLCWALIPVSRILISLATGIQYKSFVSGALYPVATHLLFGFIGALLAGIIFRKIRL
jgi:hypothetical protein